MANVHVAKPQPLAPALSLRGYPQSFIPQGPFGDKMLRVYHVIQVFGVQRLDNLDGASSHCLIVGAQGCQVYTGGKISHLFVSHTGANVVAGQIEAREPG
jgi:hypothetical protein